MNPKIALVGPGRVGCAIGKRLYEAGYPLTAIISRGQSDNIFAFDRSENNIISA